MRGFSFGLLAAAVVAADALSVLGARSIRGSESLDVFPGLAVRVVENSRGPFGLGPLWLTILGGVVTLVLASRRSVRSAASSPWALALIVGGGLANLGERVVFGRTTDFVTLGNLTALNVADVAILVGFSILLLSRTTREQSR